MATAEAVMTTAKKAANKIANAFSSNGKNDDDPGIIEPFWVDRSLERSYLHNHGRKRDELNAAVILWNSVTGQTIKTIHELKEIATTGPASYWKMKKMESHIKNNDAATRIMQEAGYDLGEVAERFLKLPEGFDNVTSAFNKAMRDGVSWPWFTVDAEGTVQFSQKLLDRMEGKVIFRAVTPLQKQRLAYAQKLKKLLSEMQTALELEADEAGIPQAKMQRIINEGHFFGPLPYPLRYETKTVGQGFQFTRTIEVNHKWVVDGFATVADQIGLPRLHPNTQKEKKEYVDNTVWLKCWRTELDGGRRPIYVRKGQESEAYKGIAGHEGRPVFEETEYRIVNGKFVPIEE